VMNSLTQRYLQTRRRSQRLCEPLGVEDYVVQSMPDASPVRWHLAHTTWFFETFVLARWTPNYHPVCGDYQVLFNSYYNRVGEQFPRARRGLLTRPTVAEVLEYRAEVDRRMTQLLQSFEDRDSETAAEIARIVELGIHHEQQHQELILTDVKHLFACNPLWPAYRSDSSQVAVAAPAATGWSRFAGGLVEIGHADSSFSFDNERPRHRTYLRPFAIANRLVTNGEYLAFVDDGGYRRADLWLALGWSTCRAEPWTAPPYWHRHDDAWHEFTLSGLQPLNLAAPVAHLSYFEADAFARWSQARLPTEAEWEHAARDVAMPVEDALDEDRYHPQPCAADADTFAQAYGELWQWTSSAYSPYPGYAPPDGALGEYNGKFMCNQYVLRGSSSATPPGHARSTYRNFFSPEARWQFTGLRLARDVEPDDAATHSFDLSRRA